MQNKTIIKTWYIEVGKKLTKEQNAHRGIELMNQTEVEKKEREYVHAY